MNANSHESDFCRGLRGSTRMEIKAQRLAAWNLAQRALVAAMMRARPAADILRRLRGLAPEAPFFFTLAQRARWAAAMRSRAEADIRRLRRPGMDGLVDDWMRAELERREVSCCSRDSICSLMWRALRSWSVDTASEFILNEGIKPRMDTNQTRIWTAREIRE